MATTHADKGKEKFANSVHSDAIWRQTIRYELNTAKNWETRWGFIRDAMIDKQSEIKRKADVEAEKLPPISNMTQLTAPAAYGSSLPSKLGPGLSSKSSPSTGSGSRTTSSPSDDAVQDWLCIYQIPRIINYRYPSEKYTFPATTSSELGWPWERTQKKMGMPYKVTLPTRFETYEDMEAARRKKEIEEEVKRWKEENMKNDNESPLHFTMDRERVPAPFTLERFGKHVRGQGDVLKWFGAREGLP